MFASARLISVNLPVSSITACPTALCSKMA
jgi:hypothetical protein